MCTVSIIHTTYILVICTLYVLVYRYLDLYSFSTGLYSIYTLIYQYQIYVYVSVQMSSLVELCVQRSRCHFDASS